MSDSSPTRLDPVATDRNYLFGVLALQLDLIDSTQFTEACACAAGKGVPLSDLLLERGWLTPTDKDYVERLLDRKVKRHMGEGASLVGVATEDARRVLRILNDPDINRTLAGLSACGGDLVSGPSLPETRGRYTLKRLHATGGIGQVWLAHDAAIGRDVALKELRPERADDRATATRFLTEVQITGQLEHPGVVPVYELARRVGDQQPFYTMRFIRGRTLTEAIGAYHQKRLDGKAEPLDLRALLSAFVGVCNTLAYAHARGVIHRDLKGANVVLGDYGEVVVLDWGLAKLLGRSEEGGDASPVALPADTVAEETLPGYPIGTPAYMSPEQAAGCSEAVGPGSDVYGLGAILYEILTGRPPFVGASLYDVLLDVLHQEPMPPGRVCGGIPPALEAICLKALAKSPAGRYASVGDLARDVQQWLADEPVAAYREPLTARLWRAARRHRQGVTAAAALLVTSLAALAIGTLLIGQEKDRTEAARAKAVANFRRACEVVNRFGVQVSQQYLLNEPGLQPVRETLVGQAVEEFQHLVEEAGDDPDARAYLGRALKIQADVAGEPRSAIEVMQRAIVIFDGLARDYPDVSDYTTDLASCHNKLGALYYSAGEHSKAESAFRQSRDMFRGLVSRFPQRLEDRNGLGLSLTNLAQFYASLGKFPKAAEHVNDGMKIREDLAQEDPANAKYQQSLADSYHARAELSWRMGHPDEAEKDLVEMRRIRERLVEAHPKVIEYRSDLAKSYNNQGLLYRRAGLREKAESAHRDALKIRSEVAGRNPTVTQYQRELAGTFRNLGNLYLDDLEKADSAAGKEQAFRAGLGLYTKALEISRKLAGDYPQVHRFQLDVGGDCSNLGNLFYYIRKNEALPWYDQAILTLENVPEKETPQEVRQALGASYWGRADILSEASIHARALADWKEALKRCRGPSAGGLRADAASRAEQLGKIPPGPVLGASKVGLLASASAAGPVVAASALVAGSAEDLFLSGDLPYHLAGVYSLLAAAALQDDGVPPAARARQAETLAARAVEMLNRAKAAGYFKDPGHRERLLKDPDLNPLRSRTDFRDLLTQTVGS